MLLNTLNPFHGACAFIAIQPDLYFLFQSTNFQCLQFDGITFYILKALFSITQSPYIPISTHIISKDINLSWKRVNRNETESQNSSTINNRKQKERKWNAIIWQDEWNRLKRFSLCRYLYISFTQIWMKFNFSFLCRIAILYHTCTTNCSSCMFLSFFVVVAGCVCRAIRICLL